MMLMSCRTMSWRIWTLDGRAASVNYRAVGKADTERDISYVLKLIYTKRLTSDLVSWRDSASGDSMDSLRVSAFKRPNVCREGSVGRIPVPAGL